MKQFREEVNAAGLDIVADQTRWGDIWAECRTGKTAHAASTKGEREG